MSHVPPIPNHEQGDIAAFPPSIRIMTSPRTLRPDNRRQIISKTPEFQQYFSWPPVTDPVDQYLAGVRETIFPTLTVSSAN